MALFPCWIITLNPEHDHVVYLLKQLRDWGFDPELFPGVDGRKQMPSLFPDEQVAQKITRSRHLCELTSSEVGGYLSHLRAIKRAYSQGFDRVCILEDDVGLEPSFESVVKEVFGLPEKVEMVRLMALKVRKRKIVEYFSNGQHQLVRPERGWCGGQGYVLNRRGMEKIIKAGSSIFEPIDKFYDHFWEYDLRLYGVEPHLIWEMSRPSNILKSNVAQSRVPWWLYWLHPFNKLWRSLKRHAYLMQHKSEFYPAELPQGKPGKTKRMKL